MIDERKMFTPIQLFGREIDEKFNTNNVQKHFQKVIECYHKKEIQTFNDFFYALSVILPRSTIGSFKQMIRSLDLPQLGKIPVINKFFRDVSLIDPQSGTKVGNVLSKMNPTTNPESIIKVAELSLGKKEENFQEFKNVLEKVCNSKPSAFVIQHFGGDGFGIFIDEDETGNGFVEGRIEERNEKMEDCDENELERKSEAERLIREAFSDGEEKLEKEVTHMTSKQTPVIENQNSLSKQIVQEQSNEAGIINSTNTFAHENEEKTKEQENKSQIGKKEESPTSKPFSLNTIIQEKEQEQTQQALDKIIKEIQTKIMKGYVLEKNETNERLLKELSQLIHFNL
ncbi:hypothetical protein EHI8A_066190 [Entamoeba histolytica HM-1:IMSS-B]|uniref:Uncharacterized protein n=6 Tax=Entamoeba histolytica TaxID=5759 RepID=C4LSP3_ENTH1|nr:hypothetical protein EHI_152040 [Entamoeba histolytica HM-1:IMSS]EMD46602.1 Hypothetical protein EHI5A_000010 [Entamoeba histolytica KU27]EMH76375.1 hypothetical protein EHI8A_066190 [Entamoeba histolytica HM-1:IMSS-B]EMS17242.1 translocation protein, putative [Entamoeba histolytica HM-3:IMSS]ENY59880.1 hypothetical protein EHI7A_000010 [Entamoeba histolytica HM-1:IMSS-A]GAT91454.1 hypothetical protein CL6EHI_152040 [Entamoeba histolytica]|eukprot:XP_657375.2 hypothetical protein EHI_152040 [Entamoeba histolytica HM-1:IMSS]